MPLFFFLSGLVFKPHFDKPFSVIVKKNIQQLLVPYFLFAFATYLFAILSQQFSDVSLPSIGWQLFGILYGNGNDGMLGFNVILWFLPCLFITRVTFAILTRKIKEKKYIGIALLFCGIIGYGISLFFPWMKLPYGFESALTGLVFFGAGYLWKTRPSPLPFLRKYQVPIIIFAVVLTLMAASYNYHLNGAQIDLRINHLNNFFLFYIGAFGGIITWVAISKLLAKNALLEYVGRHSMVIFAWHYLIFVNLQTVTGMILTDDFINSVKLVLPTLYVITAMTIILFSRLLITKLKVALVKQ